MTCDSICIRSYVKNIKIGKSSHIRQYSYTAYHLAGISFHGINTVNSSISTVLSSEQKINTHIHIHTEGHKGKHVFFKEGTRRYTHKHQNSREISVSSSTIRNAMPQHMIYRSVPWRYLVQWGTHRRLLCLLRKKKKKH